MKTVVGIFQQFQDAERAVHLLQLRGVDKNSIDVIDRDQILHKYLCGRPNPIGENAIIGAMSGAMLGGVCGVLAGMGMLVLPWMGALLALGSLPALIIATAVGLGLGALIGGLIGAIVGFGVPKADVLFYADGIPRAGFLVTVRIDSEGLLDAMSTLSEVRDTAEPPAVAADANEQQSAAAQSGVELPAKPFIQIDRQRNQGQPDAELVAGPLDADGRKG